MQRSVPFREIAARSAARASEIVPLWLPDGHRSGVEWIARNPLRTDRRRGSFRINLKSGRWADFATGDRGGDLISLAAYIYGLDQVSAARRVAAMVGMSRDV